MLSSINDLNSTDRAGPTLVPVLLNIALAAAWLWLYRAVLDYLGTIFTIEDFRTNQILLIGLTTLIFFRIRAGSGWRDFLTWPRVRWFPLTLVISTSLGYLLVERFLDINTLSGILFGIGTYGLLGLWMAPSRWRRGIPAAMMLIGLLPFGAHMDTFIGYPLRIATAEIVRAGLAQAGIASLGVDTILIFENGVSHVDLPCSGVQSLWTGALFWLAATWIEERALTVRWFLAAVPFALAMIVVNVARVAILVLVGEVWQQRLFAEMLHVPLGVLGFVFACAAGLALLRLIPAAQPRPEADPASSTSYPRLSIALLATFVLLGALYAPRQTAPMSIDNPAVALTLPSELNATPLPLEPDVEAWLTRDGADAAERVTFEFGGTTGTMILITSRTWRAHHRPERCFEVYGLDLNASETILVRPTLPVRSVELASRANNQTFQSVYWFQSAGKTTDDHGARIWADVATPGTEWVLVSVVFDEEISPEMLNQFVEHVHAQLDTEFQVKQTHEEAVS